MDAFLQEIAPDGLKERAVIGKGSFGTVWATRDRDGNPIAVKKATTCTESQVRDELQSYAAFEAQGGHPNVVQVKRSFSDGSEVALVLEAGLMDLRALQAAQAYSLPALTAAQFAVELVDGLAFVHGCGVVHRDLKPANLIVFAAPGKPSGLTIKLADFGCARALQARAGMTLGWCTPGYRAPEMNEHVRILGLFSAVRSAGDQPSAKPGGCAPAFKKAAAAKAKMYDEASDMWAAGCILGELAFGKMLFSFGFSDAECLGAMVARLGEPVDVSIQPVGRTWGQLRLLVPVRAPGLHCSQSACVLHACSRVLSFCPQPVARMSPSPAFAHTLHTTWLSVRAGPSLRQRPVGSTNSR